MSISLNREEGENGSIDWCENIASTRFYNEFWEVAIRELNIKVFKENGYFNKSQLNDVLSELRVLKEWTIKNLEGSDLKYMKGRIENLEKVIPNAFDKEDTILYIY